MSSSGLYSEIKKHPWILALVILLHMGLALLLGINLSSDDKPPMPSAQKHKIIDAVAIDAKKYDKREKQKKLAVQKKIEDKRDAEKKKVAEIKKQQELKKKKALEKKKIEKQQKELQTKKLALAKKKEQDRLKQEKLKKEKLAAEKKEKERKIKQQKAKEEEKRKELARIEAEKKRKAEEDRLRREEEKAELKRALLEERRLEEEAQRQAEYAARMQTQRQQYVMLIAQKVENNWLRPVTKTEGQSCVVIVTQTMMGDVIDVRLQSCTSDTAFQRSVERAVRKASPLPLPPNPDVFDRVINFTFKPRP